MTDRQLIDMAKFRNMDAYPDGKRTVVEDHKLLSILKFCREQKSLTGDMAEVGVWRGGVALLLAECLKDTWRRLFLFDTFKGIPYVNGKDNFHKAGDFGTETDYVSIDDVRALLKDYVMAEIHQGVFPAETGWHINNGFEEFSLVHLDVDVYQSYQESLEFFLPKMVKGGVILLDDYSVDSCEGCTLACDEFAAKHNLKVENRAGQAYFRL